MEEDRHIKSVKELLLRKFVDERNRPLRTPYFQSQLQVLHEYYFPWIVVRALNELVDEEIIAKEYFSTTYTENIVFYFHNIMNKEENRDRLETRIKNICEVVDLYSNPNVARMYGKHLESIVKSELRSQSFKIIGEHTSTFGDKEWNRTGHNLDFVASHKSGKLDVGVEVKNTFPIMDKKEIDIKIDMCNYLGIRPLFATRWNKPYIYYIENRGGFSWNFKVQMWPLGQEEVVKQIYNRLGLPVNVRTEVTDRSRQMFEDWINKQI